MKHTYKTTDAKALLEKALAHYTIEKESDDVINKKNRDEHTALCKKIGDFTDKGQALFGDLISSANEKMENRAGQIESKYFHEWRDACKKWKDDHWIKWLFGRDAPVEDVYGRRKDQVSEIGNVLTRLEREVRELLYSKFTENNLRIIVNLESEAYRDVQKIEEIKLPILLSYRECPAVEMDSPYDHHYPYYSYSGDRTVSRLHLNYFIKVGSPTERTYNADICKKLNKCLFDLRGDEEYITFGLDIIELLIQENIDEKV